MEPLDVKWYAQPNDVIGGWCVMPVDQPPSTGEGEIANFISEVTARHIAELHNVWLHRRRGADEHFTEEVSRVQAARVVDEDQARGRTAE